jgi:hypothetical protein
MGRLAKLLSFVRAPRNGANVSDAKVDPGGGSVITAEHFAAAGDDSHPVAGDYVALNADSGSGRESAIGYLDAINEPKALAGDKRIYARDEDGVLIVEVWLKNTGEATVLNASGSISLNADGSIKGANDNGFFELRAEGDFAVNGVIIDASGAVTIPASLELAGKEIADHEHSQASDSANNVEKDTGPNN